ncbi:hypothetical protein ACIG63_42155 [Streptomyces antimycoticus]|uniref:hypothetical protein n=1 Tax=Streptomyces antimycoticus TaxID=68175 RepID=UPI0037D2C3B0
MVPSAINWHIAGVAMRAVWRYSPAGGREPDPTAELLEDTAVVQSGDRQQLLAERQPVVAAFVHEATAFADVLIGAGHVMVASEINSDGHVS